MGDGEGYRNGMPASGIESPYPWQKSRRSQQEGLCVEMRRLSDGRVAVRNSADPDGPALIFAALEIGAWVYGAKDGDFDEMAA
ncbi:DUF397 domain-containing protein [Kitasatospora sp. NPDC048298]|uniref:DUF397 domain-containing protein n=1 Tax=Kitasatospora sp. NPDC048298 TaxID=3364049 RepID=UPI0037209701